MKNVNKHRLSVPLLVLGLCACGPSEEMVSVNERIYHVGTMTLVAGGCAIYDLAEPNSDLSTSAGVDTLLVRQSIVDRVVSIDVVEGDRILVSRRYGELFLKSEKPDEFTATARAGSEYLFRYWGSPDCTNSASNTP